MKTPKLDMRANKVEVYAYYGREFFTRVRRVEGVCTHHIKDAIAAMELSILKEKKFQRWDRIRHIVTPISSIEELEGAGLVVRHRFTVETRLTEYRQRETLSVVDCYVYAGEEVCEQFLVQEAERQAIGPYLLDYAQCVNTEYKGIEQIEQVV